MKIKEQQFATAAEIMFTKFTSCIGVIAKKGDMLTGIHLVMIADDFSEFDSTAAIAALKLLPERPDYFYVIGHVNMWKSSKTDVGKGFQKLISEMDR